MLIMHTYQYLNLNQEQRRRYLVKTEKIKNFIRTVKNYRFTDTLFPFSTSQ